MAMTKRHYVEIAKVIASYQGKSERLWFGEHLADVFAKDNASFDRGRFLKACGVQS
jgi:hypothetical protein